MKLYSFGWILTKWNFEFMWKKKSKKSPKKSEKKGINIKKNYENKLIHLKNIKKHHLFFI